MRRSENNQNMNLSFAPSRYPRTQGETQKNDEKNISRNDMVKSVADIHDTNPLTKKYSTVKPTLVSKTEERPRFENNISEKRKILENNMDVFLFLSAVEIERLITENSQLKSDLLNQHHQNADRMAYEQQIKDLASKDYENQNLIDDYREENEYLKQQLVDLQRKLDEQDQLLKDYDPDWKQELQELQKELDDIHNVLGTTDPDEMARELEELRKKAAILDKLGAGKSPEELEDELNKLRQKAAQLDELMKKAGGKDPDQLLKELEEARRKAAELDKLTKKLGVSPDELLKELEALRKKQKELDDLKKRCGMDPQDMLKELEKLRKNQQNKDQENDALKGKVQEMDNIKRELQQLQSENQNLKRENEMLKQQIKELQDKLRYIEQELQKTKGQLSDLQNQIQDLNFQLNSALSENDQLRGTVDQLQAENDDLNNNLDNAEGQVQETEQLKQELDDLQQHLADKENEIQDLHDNINDLDQRLQDALEKIRQLERLLGDSEKAKKDLEKKTNDMSKQLNQLLNQNDQLNNQLQQNIKQLQSVSKDQDKLNKIEQTYQDTLFKYVLVVADNMRQEKNLEALTRDFQDKNRQLQDQIQIQSRKESSIKQDLAEVDNLYQQIREYENKIALLSLEVQRLKAQKQPQIIYKPEIPISPQTIVDNSGMLAWKKRAEDLLCLIAVMGVEIESLRLQLNNGLNSPVEVYEPKFYEQPRVSFQRNENSEHIEQYPMDNYYLQPRPESKEKTHPYDMVEPQPQYPWLVQRPQNYDYDQPGYPRGRINRSPNKY